MNLQNTTEQQKARDEKFLNCATSAQSATKSDSTLIDPPAAVFVGTGGHVAVETAIGESGVIFKNIADGTVLPVMVRRILSTGTTASDFVILR